jgi:hypothetical protein
MTFVEFLEMVLARLEERHGRSRARHHGRMFVALDDVLDTEASEKRGPDAAEKASAF